MLCRHNKYVQEFGRVRDPDEVARREKVWVRTLEEMEHQTGHEAGAIRADEFRRLLAREIELPAFRAQPTRARRGRSGGHRARSQP
jgi:hypothetical protein